MKKRKKKIRCVRSAGRSVRVLEHEELPVEYDDAEYGLTTSVEPIPSNNIRRKKLYRQLTLMLNGGPLGAGVRKPLLSRQSEISPSDTFMGYKSE
jgi:hypothetical protein